MKEKLVEYIRSDVSPLPIVYIEKISGQSGTLVVLTPMGQKHIELTYRRTSLFSGTTEIKKTLYEIISEVKRLEEETKDYLVKEWLKTI